MQLKASIGFAILMSGFVFAAPSFGGTTSLADWCVNLNGDINTACNGGGSGGTSTNPDGGSISLSNFDTTLELGTNNLGSVVITLGVGNNQTAAFYADYDLDFATYLSNQDSASTSGTVPTGVSYELNDPNVSNIFSDFSGVPSPQLPDSNGVSTPSGPPTPCCDAAFALDVTGLNVLAGGSGTVTFTVSATQPTSGFYIQQTNFDVGDSIYLTESVNITAPMGPPPGVPEPSTFVLGLGGLCLCFAFRRLRSA
jgi:hypothetical protein